MKKKMMIAAAVLLLLALALGFGVRQKAQKNTAQTEVIRVVEAPAQTQQTEPAQTDAAQDEEVFEAAELLGTVTEVADDHILLITQESGPVQAFITDDTMIEGVESIEPGQAVRIVYDGKMTRSIPAQVTALLIGVYAMEGEVKAVEDGSMTLLREDTQEEVIVSLPEGAEVSVGEHVTAYTSGMMTMSLPPKTNAIAIVK